MGDESKDNTNMFLKLKEMKLNTLMLQIEVMKCREEINDLQLQILELYRSDVLDTIGDVQNLVTTSEDVAPNEAQMI